MFTTACLPKWRADHVYAAGDLHEGRGKEGIN